MHKVAKGPALEEECDKMLAESACKFFNGTNRLFGLQNSTLRVWRSISTRALWPSKNDLNDIFRYIGLSVKCHRYGKYWGSHWLIKAISPIFIPSKVVGVAEGAYRLPLHPSAS